MTDLPILCTLQPEERRARADDLLPRLAAAATLRTPIDGGYRFEFAATAGLLRDLVATIEAERHCCRFLRFQITLEPDEGPARLDVTGPEGTQAFLAAIVDPR